MENSDLTDGPIGIFGGSFDPPHLGHVALVRAAIETLDLQEVWILPAGIPVHRSLSGKADGEMRLHWLKVIFSGEDRVRVLDWEVKRSTATPTIISLQYFRSRYPRMQAVLLLGEDAGAGMPGWVGYPEHCQLIDIAVFTRTGCADRYSRLPEWQQSGVAEWQQQPGCGRQLFVERQLPDISATEIRQRCAHGTGLHGIVPESIRHEIEITYQEKRVIEPAATTSLTTDVIKAIEDKKAIDPLLIDVCGRSSVTDHFVIATGRSSRHLRAMASEVAAVAHRYHLEARIEGLEALEWVLADLGDVVVHLFLPEVRETFQLEQLWRAAPAHVPDKPCNSGS